MRRLLPLLVVMAILLSACDGDDAESPNENTTGGAGAAASEGNETAGVPDAAGLPGGDLVPCESPAGFTLSRPATWSTNSGDVVPACSLLHPEPFDVPRGTDARVAAISAYVGTAAT